ncbi:MAG TPA: tetratricopeptide repeat-containing sensor histidine kinase, partial [Cyclobacteriaceae bacterium]|nr:tetratricopeptide repeat-containing sensor histidine kinase [Cyclobacteriaceae bacterium]
FFLPISQEPNSQSRLQSLLDQVRSRPEEERDSLYYELYAHYKYNHPDSARQYALKVHELSRKYNHREVYVKSLHALGFFAREEGNYDTARKYYENGLKLAFEIEFEVGILMMINNFGQLYYYQQQYDSALYYYLEEIEYATKYNQPYDLAISYNNVASIYSNIGNYDEALNNYLKCIEIKNNNNIKVGLELNYCNAGNCYAELGKYDNAIKIINSVLNNCQDCDFQITAMCYKYLGNIYFELGDFKNAENLCKISLYNSIQRKDLMSQINNYTQLGRIYLQFNELNTSLKYLDSANEIAIRSKSRLNQSNLYQYYSLIYEKKGDFLQALNYKNKMVILRDSIFTPEQSKNIKNNLLAFQQAQNELALQEKESRIQRNRQFIYLISSITFLLLIIILFYYRALALRRKISERLGELVGIRTRELSESNMQLMSSRNDLDTFLYRTSHDIRGPITTLMGLTNIARVEGPGKITTSFLEKMDITTAKINEIINRLTNVSQINSLVPDITSFDLVALANESVSEIRNRPGIDTVINFRLSCRPVEEVRTDKNLIRIILTNLLENAFKYNDQREEDAMVALKIEQNSRLDIKIIDNGIGIDPAISGRLFDFFFVASEKRGAGLGLYQARLATQKLGGSISLVNNKKPTCFRVSLPLVQDRGN